MCVFRARVRQNAAKKAEIREIRVFFPLSFGITLGRFFGTVRVPPGGFRENDRF